MTVAFIDRTDDENNTSGTSRAFAVTTTTAGKASVVALNWKNDVTVVSVQDTQGNSYIDCGAGRITRPTDGYAQLFGAQVVTGGTTPTITATWSGTATNIYAYQAQYGRAGTGTSIWDSVFGTGTATSGTSVTSSSVAPSGTSGALIAFLVTNDGNTTAGSGFTKRGGDTASGNMLEDLIFSTSIGTISAVGITESSITKGLIVAGVLRDSDASSVAVAAIVQNANQFVG